MKRLATICAVTAFVLSVCLTTTLGATHTLVSVPSEGSVAVSTEGPDSGFGSSAAPVATWVRGSWPGIDGATWISSSHLRETNGQYGSWRLFTREFTLPDDAYNITGTMYITSDNIEDVFLNDSPVGDYSEDWLHKVYHVGTVSWFSPFAWQIVSEYSVSPTPGTNKLEILVRNYPASEGGTYEGQPGSTGNPTGLIYKIVVEYDLPITVDIDIKPGSCPNPLNVRNKGVLPVAILGSEDFDVGMIDVASIRLAGVDPNRSSYEDVATPVPDGTEVLMAITLQEEPCHNGDCDEEPCHNGDCDEEPCHNGDCDEEPDEDECDCTTAGPDDYLDLTLKFKTQDIVQALGEVVDGEELILTLTGVLSDGTPIEGEDCIRVKKPRAKRVRKVK